MKCFYNKDKAREGQYKSNKQRILNDIQKAKKLLKENDLSEIIVWIAGLISSDGCISKDGHITLISAEKYWLEHIQKKLNENNLKSHCLVYYISKQEHTYGNKYYRLNLKKPLIWYILLNTKKEYILPRKFNRLKEHYNKMFLKYQWDKSAEIALKCINE